MQFSRHPRSEGPLEPAPHQGDQTEVILAGLGYSAQRIAEFASGTSSDTLFDHGPMAQLVAAFGSSHSIMLVSQREDWQHGFRVIDAKNSHYYDRNGDKTDYEALLAAAPAGSEAMVTPEKMGERYDAAEAAMDHLGQRIRDARLDVLLIVGDDQTELFRTTNNPAFAIYFGDTIRNTAREPAAAGATAGSSRRACGATSPRRTADYR